MAIRKSRLLEGQTAIVTGGGEGVGRSIALALAARGVRVLVAGPHEKALGETVGEIAHGGGKARHVVADVRAAADVGAAVTRAVDTFGAIDIAIANAGIAAEVTLGGGAAACERARAVVDSSLLGTYNLFDAALVAMKGPGRLLVTGSALGRVDAAASAVHGAAKAGVLGLVRATALEVGARGITCNAVTSDGVVDADDVAELVVYLCSSAGDTITGQALAVGGRVAPARG